MKKKIRTITVDGVQYTWLAKREYYEIFKDRKPWIYVGDDGMITPKMIRAKILKKLEDEKETL
jgi:hypothetical protein